MARIPTGNFGYRVANLGQQNRQMPMEAFGVADGLASLSDSVGLVTRKAQIEEERLRREQEAEAKAAAKEADRVRAITAQATAKNALADLHDDLVGGLSTGRYDKNEIAGMQDERGRKLIEDSVGKVPAAHQELVRASLLDDVGRSQRDIRKAVDTKNRQDIGAGISSYMENMQRFSQRGEPQRREAMQNVEAFLQSAGPQAGMPADAIARAVQGFKENVTLTWLDNAISQNQNNAKALGRIASDISADKFPELDPGKRNFLETKIQRNQQHLMHRAEVAERRNLTNLGIMEKRLSWYVENGRDIPSSELTQFDKASKGTAYEGSAQMIVGEQRAVSEMLRLSPSQMAAKIKEKEAALGDAPSREQIIHVEKLKRFAGNTVKLLMDSPLTYAVQRDGAVVQPLDLTKPDSWADSLAARTSILKELSQRTGAPPKGLFPEDVQAISGMLRTAKPEEQSQVLAVLAKGFNDNNVYRATMQQIAPDNPVIASAGLMAARSATLADGRKVADLILQGNALLRQDTKTDGKPSGGKLLPMPEEAEMRVRFSRFVENAYAGKDTAQNVDFQAARAVYAKLASDAGDHSGKMDYGRWKDAIGMAIGKVEKWNGSHVVLPHGMDRGQFKDALRAKSAEVVRSINSPLDVTMDRLWDAPLENAGEGRYFIRAGDGYLIGKDGQKLLIDLGGKP